MPKVELEQDRGRGALNTRADAQAVKSDKALVEFSSDVERNALKARVREAVRGIAPEVSLSVDQLKRSSSFIRSHGDEFKVLLDATRSVEPSASRGAELLNFAKLFESGGALANKPELFAKICQIASASELFGKTRAELGDQAFDKLKNEFLADIVRNCVDSDNIIQGREPLCTGTSAVKLLSAAEYARLATDMALKGEATTQSGAKLELYNSFFDRAQKSSAGVHGNVFCAQPSSGSLMLLYSVMQLGDESIDPNLSFEQRRFMAPLIERQSGASWHQYARATEKLTGKKFAAAAAAAQDILCDAKTGAAVRDSSAGPTVSLTTSEYVKKQLESGKKVFIHTYFNAHASDGAVGTAHSEHAMVAEGLEVDRLTGQTWVRCSNPIGDFYKKNRGADAQPEAYEVGALLGDANGYWFKVAENGDILVQKEVFDRQLYSILVQYDESYTFTYGDQVKQFGGLDRDEGLHQFMWVDEAPQRIDEPRQKTVAPLVREEPKKRIEEPQKSSASEDAVPAVRTSRALETRWERRDGFRVDDELGLAAAALSAERERENKEKERRDEDRERRASASDGVSSQAAPAWSRTSVSAAFGYGSDFSGSVRASEVAERSSVALKQQESPQPVLAEPAKTTTAQESTNQPKQFAAKTLFG